MHHPSQVFVAVSLLLAGCCALSSAAAADKASDLAESYRKAALRAGDPNRGKTIFASKEASCAKCHTLGENELRAGPDLSVIGDKLTHSQLVESILSPSARLHPDYTTVVVATTDGRAISGVLQERTDQELRLFDANGKLVAIPLDQIDQQSSSKTSVMPNDLHKGITPAEFADLIAFLATLQQSDGYDHPGMPKEVLSIATSVKLVPFHSDSLRFDHPVWIVVKPGAPREFLVVEQQTRRIWQLSKGLDGDRKTLFVDLSEEAISGEFEGVMCLAFHPQFLDNRKYYVNYHVREEGVFSPVIVERVASTDYQRDSGRPSRRLLKIQQPTDLHWGGMLAFGPDGYLYVGAGDGGPQQDPYGNGQNLSLLLGKILRIDVNHREGDRPYAIPDSNPFKGRAGEARPEIWAYGFRMPWRFSWDPENGNFWVGDIGQNLFEEVSIARIGENHGWNVYEGFTRFSNRYRREGETFTPPTFSYRRKLGVSVTGGYVYRGKRSPSYLGAYICADFESKRIWALKQSDRQLLMVRQVGNSPERPASFGMDADGELFVVGYEGTIFRLQLDDSELR